MAEILPIERKTLSNQSINTYMMIDSCSQFILSIYCEWNYLSLSFDTFPLYFVLLIKEVKVSVIMEFSVLMLSLVFQDIYKRSYDYHCVLNVLFLKDSIDQCKKKLSNFGRRRWCIYSLYTYIQKYVVWSLERGGGAMLDQRNNSFI